MLQRDVLVIHVRVAAMLPGTLVPSTAITLAFIPIEDRYLEFVLPQMFKINAGYFLIQLGANRNRDAVYDLVGRHSRDDQICYLGLTAPGSSSVEKPDGCL